MSYRSASARAVAFDNALREAMSATVPDAIQPQGSPAADPAAGTPRPEGVTVETVAADTAAYDSGSAPPDRDRVEHDVSVVSGLSRSQQDRLPVGAIAELQRLARLRRWQAVGELRDFGQLLALYYPASSSRDRSLTARHAAPFWLKDGPNVP